MKDAMTTRVFEYITEHIAEHGYPPSMRDIAEGVGLATASSVTYHLHKLEASGDIRRDPRRPRTIVIKEHQ